MANQLYNLSSGLGGAGISPYSSRYVVASGSDTYKFEPSARFISSAADALRYASVDGTSSAIRLGQGDGLSLRGGEVSRDAALGVAQGAYSQLSLSGVEDFGASSVTESIIAAGLKRQSEALYHLGTHNTMGQSEALFSTNPLVKRPRTETASHLPIYPQRPGEKDCTYYMLTRTCKFGDACKFDHPIWVPEGGIPDWKEVPLVPTAELLPERPGEPDCPYYMKTYKCKFGVNCKFNHPKADTTDVSVLPERPSEPICSYYSKTGKCKFGANCIFNHPKDLQMPSNGQDVGGTEQNESTVDNGITSTNAPVTPALLHNSKGLPVRPGEQDCPFYLKTGSCKYGARCRFNHPDRNAINPPVAGSVVPNIINSSLSLLPNIDPRLIQTNLMMGSVTYPQRPGEPECDFYMKTGLCKFAERCKFHHPIDRSAPITSATKHVQQSVKLTLAGLPRREGSIICPFYLKTGTCKYGATCRYDHPPPGEVMAMSTSQDAGTAADAAGNTGNVTNDDGKQES